MSSYANMAQWLSLALGTVLPVAAKKLLETLTSHVQDEGND